jgi:hypothetical protein
LVVSFILSILASFIGSMLAIVWWFHFDMEDHWRLWKARKGKQMEEAKKRRDEWARTAHDELLEEERARGCQL